MILDEGNVFDNDLPQMTSRIVVFDGFQVRTFDVFLNNFKCILSCHFQNLKKMQHYSRWKHEWLQCSLYKLSSKLISSPTYVLIHMILTRDVYIKYVVASNTYVNTNQYERINKSGVAIGICCLTCVHATSQIQIKDQHHTQDGSQQSLIVIHIT